ncbi:MAG TPA: hypothetical protein VH518_15200 [Tepidisphaeraceae bacterium]|jgi:hypothetical protein
MAKATTLVLLALLGLAATPAQAGLFTLAASGTVSFGGNATIPNGTPWAFEITYDTAAPDLAPADTTFGQFANTSTPPALTAFHYKAGSYEVTLDDPSDFGPASAIDVTFTSIHAMDINIFSALFPPLAGSAVSFHADFNDFTSDPIFVSDALYTNPALGPGNFDQNTVNLNLQGPPSGVLGGNDLTSLTVTPVPEPAMAAVLVIGLLVPVARKTRP